MSEQYIKIDTDKTIKSLSDLEKKQWPYALASTLTRVAQLSKIRVDEKTRREFDLRSKKFTLKGITIRPAKKSDVKLGKAESQVYTKPRVTQYMAQHEPGALRRPIKSRTIAVPGKDLKKKNYRTSKGRVKKSYSPKELARQAGGYAWMYRFETSKGLSRTQRHNKRLKPFTIRTKTGDKAIVRRKSRKSRRLEYLWIFKKMVRIDPEWGFEKTVKKTVNHIFEKILKQRLAHAVKTAK